MVEGHKFRKDFILQGIDKSGYKYLKKSLTADRNMVKIEKRHSFDALVKVWMKKINNAEIEVATTLAGYIAKNLSKKLKFKTCPKY